jgi:hypothetical protein
VRAAAAELSFLSAFLCSPLRFRWARSGITLDGWAKRQPRAADILRLHASSGELTRTAPRRRPARRQQRRRGITRLQSAGTFAPGTRYPQFSGSAPRHRPAHQSCRPRTLRNPDRFGPNSSPETPLQKRPPRISRGFPYTRPPSASRAMVGAPASARAAARTPPVALDNARDLLEGLTRRLACGAATTAGWRDHRPAPGVLRTEQCGAASPAAGKTRWLEATAQPLKPSS